MSWQRVTSAGVSQQRRRHGAAVDSFVGRRRPNVKEQEIRFRPISFFFLSPTKVAFWKSIELALD